MTKSLGNRDQLLEELLHRTTVPVMIGVTRQNKHHLILVKSSSSRLEAREKAYNLIYKTKQPRPKTVLAKTYVMDVLMTMDVKSMAVLQ
jgi:hypothetical protein